MVVKKEKEDENREGLHYGRWVKF